MIQIYDDKFAQCVVIVNKGVSDFFYDDLIAYDDDGLVSVLSTHKEGELEFFQRAYTDFIKRDGDPAGADLTETLNYLNQQFEGLGEEGAPDVTSPGTSTAISGQLYNFQLTADRVVRFWSESGLPEGLFLQQTTGQVSGVTTATGGSPYTINYAAIGLDGVGQQTHTLTVITAPSFLNSFATQFTANRQNYCNGGTNASLFFDKTAPFSVSVWFRITGNETDAVIYSKMTAGGVGFKLTHDKNGSTRKLIVRIKGDGNSSDEIEFESTTNLLTNTWYHACITYDGSEDISGLTMYLNGVAETKANPSNGLTGTLTNTNCFCYIGARYKNAAPNSRDHFNGIIDEVSVWDVELSSANVTTIYNSGVPTDLSGESFYSDIVEWWRMGDGDSFPVLNGVLAVQDLAMTNMTQLNIVNEVPT